MFHQLKVLEIDCGCLCICEKFNRHFSNLSYQRYIIQLIKKKITITFAKIFFKFLKITFLTNTLLLFTIKTNNTFPSPTNFKFSHQFRINPYSISKDLTALEKISLEKKRRIENLSPDIANISRPASYFVARPFSSTAASGINPL